MLTETDTGTARYSEIHRQTQPERAIERQIERERESDIRGETERER